MALFDDGMPCPLCGQPMTGRQNLLAFTFVGSRHPLVRQLDDSVCHQDCLGRWEHRDEFVRAYNREASYRLGPFYFLEVTSEGKVRFLSWLGRLLYRWGWKRSPLLPELIHPNRPLLKVQLIVGRDSPLWVRTRYGWQTSNPSPEAIGLPADLAAAIRTWAERFAQICPRSSEDDQSTDEAWQMLEAEGWRLWNVLVREVGHRYRVVYLVNGYIFEPEDIAQESG